MTTAADGTGSQFGHVALVVGLDVANDRLRIQEHGGGVGPEIRWLPTGMAYDSVARYGYSRPFQLYQLDAVPGIIVEPPTGDEMADLTPEQLEAIANEVWSSRLGVKVLSRLDDITAKLSTLLDPRHVFTGPKD